MKKFITAAILLSPTLAMAQQLTGVKNWVTGLRNIVNIAIPVVVGLALLAFFWGLAMFIFNAGNEEKKGEGKHVMIYGIVALFVMATVWGIVNFIAGNLGIDTSTTSGKAPTIDTSGISI